MPESRGGAGGGEALGHRATDLADEESGEPTERVSLPLFVLYRAHLGERQEQIRLVVDELNALTEARDVREVGVYVTYRPFCAFDEASERGRQALEGPWRISRDDHAALARWIESQVAAALRARTGLPVVVSYDERIQVSGEPGDSLSRPAATFTIVVPAAPDR